ncbi:hypothetical protein [Methylobacterium flocculans]|uniref:hypothetical protein n=1 Tax=Methylobacterium flocculans TaxID=2984843 RepID=UPI0021F39D48|nr:hypothetical protein [Methylobacterium sp. FF17]
MNPLREPGKHKPKPWPAAGERAGSINGHKFVWELPDAAYDSFRAWAIRLEAGEPEAVAQAQERAIHVVVRHPPGRRDEFRDSEHVLFDISDAIHSGFFDSSKDRDESDAVRWRRSDLHMEKALKTIEVIFGDDQHGMIMWITSDCYKAQRQTGTQTCFRRKRSEVRLELGIANMRDHALQVFGPDD